MEILKTNKSAPTFIATREQNNGYDEDYIQDVLLQFLPNDRETTLSVENKRDRINRLRQRRTLYRHKKTFELTEVQKMMKLDEYKGDRNQFESKNGIVCRMQSPMPTTPFPFPDQDLRSPSQKIFLSAVIEQTTAF
jgi:hypothetical protein